MHVFLGASVLVGLALANPNPQDIDLEGVVAAPLPSFVTPSPLNTAKRSNEVMKRDGNCSPQPAGSGPVPAPDTYDNFQADPDLRVGSSLEL